MLTGHRPSELVVETIFRQDSSRKITTRIPGIFFLSKKFRLNFPFENLSIQRGGRTEHRTKEMCPISAQNMSDFAISKLSRKFQNLLTDSTIWASESGFTLANVEIDPVNAFASVIAEI